MRPSPISPYHPGHRDFTLLRFILAGMVAMAPVGAIVAGIIGRALVTDPLALGSTAVIGIVAFGAAMGAIVGGLIGTFRWEERLLSTPLRTPDHEASGATRARPARRRGPRGA